MKKTIAIAALISLGRIAGASTTEVSSLGPWPLCEASSTAVAQSGIVCAGFVAGHEQYLLEIHDTPGTGTTGYRYVASATLASTGQSVSISGYAERSAVGGTDTTGVTLNFGGVVGDITVTVFDTVATAVVVKVHAAVQGRR